MKMKKTAVILAAVAAMAMSSVCSASIGSQLDRDNSTSTRFLNVISQKDTETSYERVAASFDENMKKTITAVEFFKKQREVEDKLGTLQKLDFIQYQKAQDQNKNNVDILTYVADFSKQHTVLVAMVYDAKGKMVEFRFTPLVQKAQAAQPAAAK